MGRQNFGGASAAAAAGASAATWTPASACQVAPSRVMYQGARTSSGAAAAS